MGVPETENREQWRTLEFRQNVRQKIEEAIRKTPSATYRNAGRMEEFSFARAATKDQYLVSVARLIIRFREKESRRASRRALQQQQVAGQVGPMVALRTMTNRASGLPTGSSRRNLIQSLNPYNPPLLMIARRRPAVVLEDPISFIRSTAEGIVVSLPEGEDPKPAAEMVAVGEQD